MHYYKRNLGDYAKKAGRLSMLQHGSYTLLIDACYDREQFPTLEEAIEWTWASSSVEIEAVEFVLRKFFVLENGVYVQKRIQEELAEYHGKAETNKRIAIERETKRKEKSTNRVPVVNELSEESNEPPPNHKPITINQEPETNKKNKSGKPLLTFSSWNEKIKQSGETPIPENHEVFEYAKRAKIPDDFLRACWVEFRERYSLEEKKYRDWRAVFYKAVRGNWFELWYYSGNEYLLTTKGHQALTAMNNQRKAA